jgi:MmpS family membrane protein
MMHRANLALATLALCALGGCGAGADSAAAPSTSIPAERFRLDGTTVSVPLILEVSGDATADITYAPERGTPSAQVSAATPWSKTFQVSSGAALLPTLTARTSGTGANATITCRIKIAGILVEAKTANGPRALASCSLATAITPTP